MHTPCVRVSTGHFLLTHLLADLLINNEKPTRIINVSSLGHKFIDAVNFDDLMFAKGFDSYKAYFQSKLAVILFTRELAQRLQGMPDFYVSLSVDNHQSAYLLNIELMTCNQSKTRLLFSFRCNSSRDYQQIY